MIPQAHLNLCTYCGLSNVANIPVESVRIEISGGNIDATLFATNVANSDETKVLHKMTTSSRTTISYFKCLNCISTITLMFKTYSKTLLSIKFILQNNENQSF